MWCVIFLPGSQVIRIASSHGFFPPILTTEGNKYAPFYFSETELLAHFILILFNIESKHRSPTFLHAWTQGGLNKKCREEPTDM